MKEKFYITTPIYYPSGKWHIGTCYTTVVCDSIARFKRMQGYDVFYLTGTDEHGQKIEQSAKANGISPKEWVDKQVDSLKKLWELFDISYDKFIRTTDPEHKEQVQKIFKRLYDKGDIYKSEYEGWYCVPCESFWTKSQLKDGKCPDCGREVELAKESSYFFRLSKYADKILKLYEDNPCFLEPKSRVNEMINSFLKPGLSDLAVSRTSFKWGVPVPFDDEHVVYVWIDALTNYITALGYASNDDTLYKKFWPADVHMMAKEIVRFHAIIWPAILMALDIPLPKKVYGHGWLLFDGGKISKSKGNIVDPVELARRFGTDAVRYYLLREVPFGQDGLYTNELLIKRINTDLVNTLGNLVSRTEAMINQYFNGILPAFSEEGEFDSDLKAVYEGLYDKVCKSMDSYDVPEALSEIFKAAARANKYIDETMPWVLYKEGKTERLKTVLYNLSECIRILAVYLKPYLTKSPDKIFSEFSVAENLQGFDSVKKFGALKGGEKVIRGEALFKRIDLEKELKDMEAFAEKQKSEKKEEKAEGTINILEITIDEFKKVELKVGTVTAAEKVEKSQKLLKLTVEGDRVRTIVSGIAQYYTPEELVGKQIVYVANLKPAKLCGIVSEGMILCAEDESGVTLLAPLKKVKNGSGVS